MFSIKGADGIQLRGMGINSCNSSGRGLREARFLSGESAAGPPLTTTTLWTSVLNSLSVLSFENKYIIKPKGKGRNEDEKEGEKKELTPSDHLVVEF